MDRTRSSFRRWGDCVAYDRYDWHSGGNFPADLPAEAGGTHIAMFLCWMILRGHAGTEHREDSEEVMEPLVRRELTPGEWFFKWCDGKFWNADLDEDGNSFARAYYAEEGQPFKHYIDDYAGIFPDHPNVYSVPDTWASFDRISPKIEARYLVWKDSQRSFFKRTFR